MMAKRSSKPVTSEELKAALAKEPGLTVKDLANRLDVDRQFMAGFLAALEERGGFREGRSGQPVSTSTSMVRGSRYASYL